MIPKIIHYCWFGHNPLPSLALKCKESWARFFPDYEIKEWNEDNFDVNIIPYTAEAYKAKKYAFVSDYARFWILYKYGGLYFDTDVEIIKPMDDIIMRGPFMGCELSLNKETGLLTPFVAPGLGLGACPGLDLYKNFLDIYSMKVFMSSNCFDENIVTIATEYIVSKRPSIDLTMINEVEGVYIYPDDFFCPIVALTGKMTITENTRSIHHYMASWMPPKTLYMRICIFLRSLCGDGMYEKIRNIKRRIFK